MYFKIIIDNIESKINNKRGQMDTIKSITGPEQLNQTFPICRICLQQSASPHNGNLIIIPCNCKGTSEHVHQQCIIKWIKHSKQKYLKDKNGSFIHCDLCRSPIYFNISSQSWKSWCKNQPCSAIFYLSWIIILLLSLIVVIFLVVYAIVTEKYEILRFMGFPFGVLIFGGFLFYQCGKDFRNYKTGIITIKQSKIKKQKQRQNGYSTQSALQIKQ